MTDEPLVALALHLAAQSLLAIGGLSVILAELHRVVVLTNGWLTDTQFTTLFALAQAAPGPNMLFVTLIGWSVGGIGGALAATASFVAPAFVIAGVAARLWDAWNDRAWFTILRRGLVPLTVGLIVASALLVAAAAATGPASYLVTAVTVGVALFTRIHPGILLVVAAAFGAAGLV